MGIFDNTYSLLNVAGITSLVGSISPNIIQRGQTVPAITYDVRNSQAAEIAAGTTGGWIHRVDVACYALTAADAEEIAQAVVTVVNSSNNFVVDEIERNWVDGISENQILRIHTVALIATGGA